MPRKWRLQRRCKEHFSGGMTGLARPPQTAPRARKGRTRCTMSLRGRKGVAGVQEGAHRAPRRNGPQNRDVFPGHMQLFLSRYAVMSELRPETRRPRSRRGLSAPIIARLKAIWADESPRPNSPRGSPSSRTRRSRSSRHRWFPDVTGGVEILAAGRAHVVDVLAALAFSHSPERIGMPSPPATSRSASRAGRRCPPSRSPAP